jgi:hypothetical protein
MIGRTIFTFNFSMIRTAGRKLFFMVAFCWGTLMYGQSSYFNDFYVKAAYHPGYVMPEYTLYDYLVNDYARAFTVSVTKRPPGKTYWAQLYNYPEFGLAIQYATLGNSEVFGHEWSVYPFFNVHILESGKISLINQLGLGVGFANKKFDLKTNPYNVAVGTTLNCHFNFELNLQYQALKKFYLYTGIGFDHFSNGNLGEPNLGINYMTFSAGMRYLVGEKSEENRFDIERYVPSTRMSLVFTAGVKHARALLDKSYLVTALSFELKPKWWRVFYPGIGADIFYDRATKDEENVFGDEPYASIDNFKTGFHLTQELVYNKFSIALQEGFYVLLTDKAFGHTTYHRFIIRHQISDRFFLQLSMKAHVVVLDYLELGIGYHIKP